VGASILYTTEHLLTGRGKQKGIDSAAVTATTANFSNLGHSDMPRLGTQNVLKIGSNDKPEESSEGVGRYVNPFSRQYLPQFRDQRVVKCLELGRQVRLAFDN
jgi:hypothetical protein